PCPCTTLFRHRDARRDLALAPGARAGFEMAVLRMLAFRPDVGEVAPPSPGNAQPASRGGRSAAAAARAALAEGAAAAPPAPAATAPDRAPDPPAPAPAAPVAAPAAAPAASGGLDHDGWIALVD